jgi:hypothetical protein
MPEKSGKFSAGLGAGLNPGIFPLPLNEHPVYLLI